MLSFVPGGGRGPALRTAALRYLSSRAGLLWLNPAAQPRCSSASRLASFASFSSSSHTPSPSHSATIREIYASLERPSANVAFAFGHLVSQGVLERDPTLQSLVISRLKPRPEFPALQPSLDTESVLVALFACARLQTRDSGLVASLCSELSRNLPNIDTRDLLIALDTLSRLRYPAADSLSSSLSSILHELCVAAVPRVVELSPEELVCAFCALSRLGGFTHFPLLNALCSAAAPKIGSFTPRELSKTFSYLASLRFSDRGLLRLIYAASAAKMSSFSSFDVARTLSALSTTFVSRLGLPEESLLQSLRSGLILTGKGMTPESRATVLKALADLRIESAAPLWEELCYLTTPSDLRQLNPKSLALSYFLLSRKGSVVANPRFFHGLCVAAQKRAEHFEPAELAVVFDAIAKIAGKAHDSDLGIDEKMLIKGMCETVLRKIDRFTPKEVVRVLEAIARLGVDTDRAFLQVLCEACTKHSADLKPEHLPSILNSLAKLSHSAPSLLSALARRGLSPSAAAATAATTTATATTTQPRHLLVVDRLDGRGLADLLQALAALGADDNGECIALAAAAVDRLERKIREQASASKGGGEGDICRGTLVCNALYGISVFSRTLARTQAGEALALRLFAKASRLDVSQLSVDSLFQLHLSQRTWSLERPDLKLDFGRPLLPDLAAAAAASSASSSSSSSFSRLQLELSTVLQSIGVVHTLGLPPFSDVLLTASSSSSSSSSRLGVGGVGVALQANVFERFAIDSNGRQAELGGTQKLVQRMLRKEGKCVLVVEEREWREMGGVENKKREFVEKILKMAQQEEGGGRRD